MSKSKVKLTEENCESEQKDKSQKQSHASDSSLKQKRLSQQGLLKKSPHYQTYLRQFKKQRNIPLLYLLETIDFGQQIKYCPNHISPNIYKCTRIQTSSNFKVMKFEVMLFKFRINVSVLNLTAYDQIKIDFGEQINHGTFGKIYQHQLYGTDYIIKCLCYDKQNPQKTIRNAIKEYCFNLLLQKFQIAPRQLNIFGFDLVTTDVGVYFSNEKGIDLQEILYLKNQMEFKMMGQQLERCLLMMHEMNITHNDIKPNNIVYSPSLKKLVFIDFGLSQLNLQNLGYMKKQTAVGTMNYNCDQMMMLFFKSQEGFVDMYYNDYIALKKTLDQLKANSQLSHLGLKMYEAMGEAFSPFNLKHQINHQFSLELSHQNGYFDSFELDHKKKKYYYQNQIDLLCIYISYLVYEGKTQTLQQFLTKNPQIKVQMSNIIEKLMFILGETERTFKTQKMQQLLFKYFKIENYMHINKVWRRINIHNNIFQTINDRYNSNFCKNSFINNEDLFQIKLQSYNDLQIMKAAEHLFRYHSIDQLIQMSSQIQTCFDSIINIYGGFQFYISRICRILQDFRLVISSENQQQDHLYSLIRYHQCLVLINKLYQAIKSKVSLNRLLFTLLNQSCLNNADSQLLSIKIQNYFKTVRFFQQNQDNQILQDFKLSLIRDKFIYQSQIQSFDITISLDLTIIVKQLTYLQIVEHLCLKIGKFLVFLNQKDSKQRRLNEKLSNQLKKFVVSLTACLMGISGISNQRPDIICMQKFMDELTKKNIKFYILSKLENYSNATRIVDIAWMIDILNKFYCSQLFELMFEKPFSRKQRPKVDSDEKKNKEVLEYVQRAVKQRLDKTLLIARQVFPVILICRLIPCDIFGEFENGGKLKQIHNEILKQIQNNQKDIIESKINILIFILMQNIGNNQNNFLRNIERLKQIQIRNVHQAIQLAKQTFDFYKVIQYNGQHINQLQFTKDHLNQCRLIKIKQEFQSILSNQINRQPVQQMVLLRMTQQQLTNSLFYPQKLEPPLKTQKSSVFQFYLKHFYANSQIQFLKLFKKTNLNFIIANITLLQHQSHDIFQAQLDNYITFILKTAEKIKPFYQIFPRNKDFQRLLDEILLVSDSISEDFIMKTYNKVLVLLLLMPINFMLQSYQQLKYKSFTILYRYWEKTCVIIKDFIKKDQQFPFQFYKTQFMIRTRSQYKQKTLHSDKKLLNFNDLIKIICNSIAKNQSSNNSQKYLKVQKDTYNSTKIHHYNFQKFNLYILIKQYDEIVQFVKETLQHLQFLQETSQIGTQDCNQNQKQLLQNQLQFIFYKISQNHQIYHFFLFDCIYVEYINILLDIGIFQLLQQKYSPFKKFLSNQQHYFLIFLFHQFFSFVSKLPCQNYSYFCIKIFQTMTEKLFKTKNKTYKQLLDIIEQFQTNLEFIQQKQQNNILTLILLLECEKIKYKILKQQFTNKAQTQIQAILWKNRNLITKSILIMFKTCKQIQNSQFFCKIYTTKLLYRLVIQIQAFKVKYKQVWIEIQSQTISQVRFNTKHFNIFDKNYKLKFFRSTRKVDTNQLQHSAWCCRRHLSFQLKNKFEVFEPISLKDSKHLLLSDFFKHKSTGFLSDIVYKKVISKIARFFEIIK